MPPESPATGDWQTARGRFDDTRAEDLTKAVVTLFVFIFMAAGFTQAVFLGDHPS